MSAVEVALAGDIDLAVAEEVRGRLATAADEAIRVGGSLCVDLAGVTFLDSTGIACLAVVVNRLRPYGLAVQLVRVPAPVQRVLVIGGLAEAFDLDPR